MSNVFATFIKDKGLYDEIAISQENIADLIELVNGQTKLDCFCRDCGEMRIFTMEPITFVFSVDETTKQICSLGDHLQHIRDAQALVQTPHFMNDKPEDWYWSNWQCFSATRVMVFQYVCSMDDSHRIDYVVYTNEKKLWKIGQYPSVADLTFPELDRYKKVIDEDDRKELGRAIGLYAQGIGIGSYVYLRRIFERILEKAKEQASKDKKLDNEAYGKARVSEKIAMLKDYLPKMMVENAPIYGIISKGIHELREEDCIAYFPIMKDSIFMILRQWEEKRKEEETAVHLQAAISRINAGLK